MMICFGIRDPRLTCSIIKQTTMNKKICGQPDNLLQIRHLGLILATSLIIACAGITSIEASSPVHTRNSTLTINSTLHANKNQTLLSPDGVFELGFYSGRRTNDSQIVYTLAIWYAQIPSTEKTVVWMANRTMNLSTNATLVLSQHGDLQVFDDSRNFSSQPLWSSNTSSTSNSRERKAMILDSGNFVVVNSANTHMVYWQSFNSPTDTLLPNQAFAASANLTLYSWRTHDDWTPSRYTLAWTNSNLNASWHTPYSQWSRTAFTDYWRYGVSAGQALSSVKLTSDGVFLGTSYAPLRNTTAIGTSHDYASSSNPMRRVTFDVDGNLRMYSWYVGISIQWTVDWAAISARCTIFFTCGPWGICTGVNECLCPTGFEYIDASDPTQGCRRTFDITFCNNSSDGISSPPNFKLVMNAVESVDYPRGGDYRYISSSDVKNCTQTCLNSCDCDAVAVSTLAADGTYKCWFKKGTLVNGYNYNQRITWIRMVEKVVADQGGSKSTQRSLMIAGTSLGSAIVAVAVCSCVLGIIFLRRKLHQIHVKNLEQKWVSAKGQVLMFSYEELRLATVNFSDEIGKGGYGSVFMGQIGSVATVAVKRLGKITPEQDNEFLREVNVIGRVHHVNLVHLHGYCTAGRHRMLVYEYVRNSSLDKVLFHPKEAKLPLLEWRPRVKIAIETARGLAYLHEDVCDQRIIHCDVKPENILLDSTLSVKVADFGLLRVMNKEQTRTMTIRVRGTSGYLAPEWASELMPITPKTDVFSYGMVLLEIVSGRRNLKSQTLNSDSDTLMFEPDWYFPLWAFPKLESRSFLEVVDPLLRGIVNAKEVETLLQVAFWCINEKPEVRPTMAMVVQMLAGNVAVDLPVPRPSFLDSVSTDNKNQLQGPLPIPSLHSLPNSQTSISSHRSPQTTSTDDKFTFVD